ncbi:hypothetical protein [Vibrio harveyi]|uniref:hypothetical protein n=1 Tax=Vibrio harveyi TaxID=669 RepID=UPI003CEE3B45
MLFDIDVNDFIDQLVEKYNYRPLPKNISENARQTYLSSLPLWCKLDGDDVSLVTKKGKLIASGYSRIVVGDYGPFLEIAPENMLTEALIVHNGEEYRLDPVYRDKYHIKYGWYTIKGHKGIKVYHQFDTVEYADYRKGMYYISPFDLRDA